MGVDRRRDQFDFTSGHFFVPAPYSVPGIGTGMVFIGMASNINNSQTDIFGDVIIGDIEGYGLGITDYYLLEKHLKLDIFYEYIDNGSIQSFTSRGMNSGKDDYINLGFKEMDSLAARLTNSYFDKQLEFYVIGHSYKYEIDFLKDKDDNFILDTTKTNTQKSKDLTSGFTIDLTDDKVDPRRGIRYDFSLNYNLEEESNEVDFYTENHNLSFYLPIGNISTWAFNYFISDAYVISQGDTDFDSVASSLGLDCSELSGKDKASCENTVDTYINANKYGTADSLGGRSRLRSYPEGRFTGAHSEFYGTELRWNLTDESTPFDIWFMKDIRTSIQTAFFYEIGSVSDIKDKLGSNKKESYGAGIRMITGSGIVYRLDTANGDEGFEFTIIINYPWELF
jgi:outer membrane protein assembly factor BamA